MDVRSAPCCTAFNRRLCYVSSLPTEPILLTWRYTLTWSYDTYTKQRQLSNVCRDYMLYYLSICSYGCEVGNKSEYLAAYEKTPQQFMDNPIIHWEAIWWINRPTALWVIEVFFALISLVEALLVAYLSFKVRIHELFSNSTRHFLCRIVTCR